MSVPFILKIIDPCLTTKIFVSSPFLDLTYVLGGPKIDLKWSSDADLGNVAISPKSCGIFDVTFWLLDEALNPIQDVKTLTNPKFTVDLINRVFSVATKTNTDDIGTYLIAYKVTIPVYPTISGVVSKPFEIFVTQ
jgi:hypothetical protein